jgi:hypothetical protein
MDSLAIVLLTLFLAIIFGLIFSKGEVEKVKANWAERRCEPGVMFAGFLYKSNEDPRSSSEFAVDNFSFCMKSLVDSVMQKVMAPIFFSFKSLVATTEAAAKPLNNMRLGTGNIFRGFTSILDSFHGRFQQTGMQFMRISARIQMAFNRMLGIILSTFYAGLSSFIASTNFIAFIIRVVIIIMLIMLAIFIILIFILFPFMPIIMSAISVIAIIVTIFTGIMVDNLSDIEDGFCFAGDTQVQMADGSMKSINVIEVGDKLKGCCVEGMLEFDGHDVQLFEYKGVHVSGEHLVRDSRRGWMKISDTRSPLAPKQAKIYSLITSNNRIPVIGRAGLNIEFADWEEFSEDSVIANVWHELVQSALKISYADRLPPATEGASIREDVLVKASTGDMIPIKDIKIGDWIADRDNKYVRVIGKCQVQDDASDVFTTGTWILSNGKWKQYSGVVCNSEAWTMMKRYHLITTSGTFIVSNNTCVRDFTEVGIANLKNMSSDVVNMLNCPPRP